MVKLVVVNNDSQGLEQEISVMKLAGYEASSCRMPQLFDFLEEEGADVIFLDISLSWGDGLRLLKQLRLHPDYQETPVIVLTGDRAPSLIKQCFDAGVTDYIRKPIDVPTLQARIQSALSIQNYIQELKEKTDELEDSLSIQQFLNDNLMVTTRELQETQNRLVQTQKMEAIGVLAGGVAHEFNNLLFAILGYAELIQFDLPLGDDNRECIDQVIVGGRRAKELVEQMLTFSRMEKTGRSAMELVPLTKEILKHEAERMPKNIKVEREIHLKKGRIDANPSEIMQAIVNLCSNACAAMKESGGVLTVKLSEEMIEDDFAQLHELKAGNHFKLTIADSGMGIAPEKLEHVFEPFYTTKTVGEGTGMGLAVVHGIVRGHQGAILVESTVGEGTCFTVYLPESEPLQQPKIRDPVSLNTNS